MRFGGVGLPAKRARSERAALAALGRPHLANRTSPAAPCHFHRPPYCAVAAQSRAGPRASSRIASHVTTSAENVTATATHGSASSASP